VQFDALEIHYDDEHRRYHICGANFNQETGKLEYFLIDRTAGYFTVGAVRDVFKQQIQKDENGIPIKWEKSDVKRGRFDGLSDGTGTDCAIPILSH
jgi:hypothetical protein